MADVDDLIAAIPGEARRADARRLVEIMGRVTGEPPKLHGSMIGFGHYHYRYASGHEGDSFLVGFAPRKDQFSIYLSCVDAAESREALLARLGKHKMGKGCLYVKRLSDVDEGVLEQLVANSVAALKERYPS
ncbi:MAG TPA: DUF1801 domain-containing protein [Caulobacteraceae bacterium]|nr:DUF1801 domain-containing protein [Caulobacteraceae bacterium]